MLLKLSCRMVTIAYIELTVNYHSKCHSDKNICFRPLVIKILIRSFAKRNSMEVLIFVFAVGVAIVGGIYLWTFTKSGKKWLASL